MYRTGKDIQRVIMEVAEHNNTSTAMIAYVPPWGGVLLRYCGYCAALLVFVVILLGCLAASGLLLFYVYRRPALGTAVRLFFVEQCEPRHICRL